MHGWWDTSMGAFVVALFPWVAFAVWSHGQAAEHVAWVERHGEPFRPLNKRWGGYDADDAAQYWGYLKAHGGQDVEVRFLHRDLAFPVVYGGAIALAIAFFAWRMERDAALALLALPLAAVVADWTENTRHLAQIERPLPEPKAITVASAATRIKLGAVVASFWAIVYLLAKTLCSLWTATPATVA